LLGSPDNQNQLWGRDGLYFLVRKSEPESVPPDATGS
jgi:hypothetical protein